MTTKTMTAAPVEPDDGDDEGSERDLQVTLVGHASRQAREGADRTQRTRGDFVIEATLAVAAMTKWEHLGFRIFARDRFGREFELSPAILGIKPPPSLQG